MPKRVIDGDAIWTSFTIKRLPEEYRLHYSFLLPLATDNGTFECDPRLVHATAYSFLMPHISSQDVSRILDSFFGVGLLYRWADGRGKQFGLWTGFEKPGRWIGEKRLLEKHGSVAVELHPKSKYPVFWQNYAQYIEKAMDTNDSQKWLLGFGFGVGFGVGSGIGFGSQDQEVCSSTNTLPKKQEQKPDEGVPIPDVFEKLGITLTQWQDYRLMREKINRHLTPGAIDLLKNQLLELNAAGEDVVEVLNQAIRDSSYKLYPIRKENSNGTRKEYSRPRNAIAPVPGKKYRTPTRFD